MVVPPVSAPGAHMKKARPRAVASMSERTVSQALIHCAGVVSSQSPWAQGYWPETLNSWAKVTMTGCPKEAIAEPNACRYLLIGVPFAPIVVMAGKFQE